VASGQRFVELLTTLRAHDVRFVVVGAAAAVFDGAPITTFDLDVTFDPATDNLERLGGALEALDARYDDPAGRSIFPDLERLATLRVHLLRTRHGRLDLMREIGAGFGWTEALARSHEVETPAGAVRVLDLDAVIETERAANRAKDRAALPLLIETLRLRDSGRR
jgi:hypothetical protein